jgi:uncharacterized protein (TIGR02996 family)
VINESAFWDTIKAAADPSGPKLVYADWLEDEGKSEWALLFRGCSEGELAMSGIKVKAEDNDRLAALFSGCKRIIIEGCQFTGIKWPTVLRSTYLSAQNCVFDQCGPFQWIAPDGPIQLYGNRFHTNANDGFTVAGLDYVREGYRSSSNR